jgi:hypothetical protein
MLSTSTPVTLARRRRISRPVVPASPSMKIVGFPAFAAVDLALAALMGVIPS